MEEEAELALLEQRLQQTNKLASRMTGRTETYILTIPQSS
jgi:hypothetical protein